jgi:hypothetical protein
VAEPLKASKGRPGRAHVRPKRWGEAASGVAGARATDSYRITTGCGESTEELVEAGNYGYAHSCVRIRSTIAFTIRPPCFSVRVM